MNPLLHKYAIISDQVGKEELDVVLSELRRVLNGGVMGDVVEMGCYVGTTSLFLQRMLIGIPKTLHVYDSFAGLPAKTSADQSPVGEQYQAGELKATKATLIKNFKQAGLQLPVIHKAWFNELTATDMPKDICFAYLDGDFYESITASLRLVWPRLSAGAVVVADDYYHQALPGAKSAVDAWLSKHSASLRIQASLAVLRKT